MKSLFITSIMRKFIIFGVVFFLSLAPLTNYAFADDDPVVSPTTTGDSDFDQELYSLATTLYKLESADGVKAATASRTIDDIYNLLVQIFYNQSNGTNEIVVMRQFLNTINTSCNALVVKLTEFYNSVNGDFADTGITIYDQLSAISTALTSIDGDDGDLTIIETLVYIHTALEDLDTSLTAILNSTYSIDNKLVNINTALIQFKSDVLSSLSTINTSINIGFTNVNANMASIISRLESMQNDFNNIFWQDYGQYLGFSDSLANARDSIYSNVNGYYQTGVYVFQYTNNYSNIPVGIFRTYFRIALNGNNIVDSYNLNPNISIYINNISTPLNPDYYTIINSGQYFYITFIGLPFSEINNQKIYFVITSPNSSNYYFFGLANSSPKLQYVSYDSLDYYTVSNTLISQHHFDLWQKLYASPDLIKAKEDQQVYEDQAIEDFTGSGSAAASGSDLTDMKSISGAIKSGLQSGGSVNNALAPFNTNSGFWGWFSQSNYDNINNIPVTRLRSGNNNEPEIIDFYSNNQYTLQGLLNGGGN